MAKLIKESCLLLEVLQWMRIVRQSGTVAHPIELVDGKLVRMFERLELGVKPKVVYEVDLDFFNDFQ